MKDYKGTTGDYENTNRGFVRSSVEVYDVTADAETRSVLVLSDETMIISSVSANALNKRIHEDYDK